ncbi:MAG: quinone oxidoreductase, partial [Alphaproteobacteria bacterium]|nr:quinone oxidoreductase [Alphaproteobacteria bacterium]
MKAVQIQNYGGPEVVEIIDIPTPAPDPGQVLVKAHTFGLGYPDVLLRTGVYKWRPALPSILGNEMSGHIEAVGTGVTGFEIGQPVLVFGTGGGRHAEYNAVDTALVTPLPEAVDLEAAVSIPNYLVGWAML